MKMSKSNRTAFIYHTACLGHNMGEGHPESPNRLAGIKQRLMEEGVFGSLYLVEAPVGNTEDWLRVHDEQYVKALFDSAPTTGTNRLDSDTAMNSGTIPAIQYATGAVVKAVDMVMNDEILNAFCAIRPPGHHAGRDFPMGFCFINNVAVAAAYAMEKYNLSRVLIVDFDVHHGNGTEDIFKDDERVMFLSVFQHPFFPYSGDKQIGSNPNIIGMPMPEGTGGLEFREKFLEEWLPKINEFQPEMVFISAGFDAHSDDDMGSFTFTEADFAWITRQLKCWSKKNCNGHLVSVLEGGYDVDPLSRAATAHIRTLLDQDACSQAVQAA
ncbi:MAG: histone deacetylase family protein [Neisseriaceae bacterium]|nr:histone deacetylase family protein [Neisseriaceae bacterium]